MLKGFRGPESRSLEGVIECIGYRDLGVLACRLVGHRALGLWGVQGFRWGMLRRAGVFETSFQFTRFHKQSLPFLVSMGISSSFPTLAVTSSDSASEFRGLGHPFESFSKGIDGP